jgi:hypothetical protein
MKPATWTTATLPRNPGEACHHRSAAAPDDTLLRCRRFSCQLGLPFAPGFSWQSNLVRVVSQAVEDHVSQGWLPDRLMPVINGQLTGHHHGSAVIAVIMETER